MNNKPTPNYHRIAAGQYQWHLPQDGWTLRATYDLGPHESNWRECEMCVAARIRYEHVIVHPDSPVPELVVGSVCVTRLCSPADAEKAVQAEQRLKTRLSRRKRWPKLAGWRGTAKGGLMLRRDERLYLVSPRGPYFRASILSDNKWVNLCMTFKTADEAKLALFDFEHPNERKA